MNKFKLNHALISLPDAKEYGYDIFSNVPNTACDMSRALRRERKEAKQQRMSSNSDRTSNLNGLLPGKKEEQKPEDLDQERVTTTIKQNGETSATKTGSATTTTATTMVKLEPGTDEDSNNNKNNEELNANVENNLVTSVVNVKNEVKKEVEAEAETEAETETNAKVNTNSSTRLDEDQTDIETMDSELNGDIFEFEEADVPLPPLYLLKDEGSDKWVLLNDLCNLLKVKSKDTLLNKVCAI